MEHFRDQERELCDSIGNCARVVVDLGGAPINTESTRTYSEIEATGVLFAGRPISRLIDDDGQAGIVRSDLLLVEVPPSCAYRNLIDVYATSTSYVDFARKIQSGLHDDVHDYIGGLMPTYASPSDPLFMIWRSLIDLLLYIWEICNIENDADRSIFSTAFDPFDGDTVSTFTDRGAKLSAIYISFLICSLEDRKVPSDDYRRNFLDGNIMDPKCNFILSQLSDNAPQGSGGNVPSPVVMSPSPSLPRTISINWFIPEIGDEDVYLDRRVQVGDTVVFT